MNKRIRRCMRKIIAAAMVLTLVGGLAPVQPLADLFKSSSITVQAVDYNGPRQNLQYDYDESTRTMTIKAGVYENPRFSESDFYEMKFDKIVAEDGVVLKGNCSGLFSAYANWAYPGVYYVGTYGVKEIDLHNVDTSEVTDMSHMFEVTGYSTQSYLESLDISGFDTSKVTDMSYMFGNCKVLCELDVSGFNTSSLTNIGNMFYNCNLVEELDLSGFDTTNLDSEAVNNNVFYGCNSLKKIKLSDKMAISTNYYLRNNDTSGVGTVGWYKEDDAAKEIVSGEGQYAEISGAGTYVLKQVDEDLKYSFKKGVLTFESGTYTKEILNAILNVFGNDNVTELKAESGVIFTGSMDSAFFSMNKLETADLSKADLSGITDASSMFNYCNSLKKVDFGSNRITNVTNISRMFYYCQKLTELDLSVFDGASLTNVTDILNSCDKLEKLTIPSGINVTTGWSLPNSSDSSMGYKGWAKEDDLDTIVSGTEWHAAFDGPGTFIHVKNNYDVKYSIDKVNKTLTLEEGSYNSKGMTDILNEYSVALGGQTYSGSVFPKKIIVNDGVRFYGNCAKMFWISGGSDYHSYSYNTELELGNVDTSDVTDMSYMFAYIKCSKLDFSNYDTSNVTNMSYMFQESDCDTLDLTGFDLTSLTNATYMFNNCTSPEIKLGNGWKKSTGLTDLKYFLKGFDGKINAGKINLGTITSMQDVFAGLGENAEIDFAGLDTSKVTSMYYMFNEAKMKSLDLSGLDASKVTNSRLMFYKCENLETLKLPDMTGGALTEIGSMFSACSSLKAVDLTKLNTENVKVFDGLFNGCSSLTEIDISKLNTQNVTETDSMFKDCSSLKKLDISSMDMKNVTTISNMFENCSALTELDLGEFDTQNTRGMYRVFYGCESLPSINLGKINASKVSQLDGMFADCKSLKSLDLSGFENANPSYSVKGMFKGCASLESIDLSKFSMPQIKNLESFLEGCSSLTEVKFAPKAVGKVTYVKNLFKDCSSLKSVDMSDFDVSTITNATGMFSGCTSLTNIDTALLNSMTSLTNAESMYSGCSGIKSVSFGDLESKITNFTSMFENCTGLETVDIDKLASNPDTKVSLKNMFKGCTALQTFSVNSQSKMNVSSIEALLEGCTSLKTASLNGMTTSSVTSMANLFKDCTSLEKVDMNELETDSVTTMASMFENCSSLKAIVYPEIKTRSQKLLKIDRMYNGCSSLESAKMFGTKSSTSSYEYTSFSQVLIGCKSLKEFDASNASSFGSSNTWFFSGADALETLTLPSGIAIRPGYDSLVNGNASYSGWYKADDPDKAIISGDSNYANISAFSQVTTIKRDKYIIENNTLSSASLSLEGLIRLNFYTRLTDDILNDEGAYVKFTANGNSVNVPVSEAAETSNGYKFKYDIAAKELHDRVTIELYDGSGKAAELYNSKGEVIGTSFEYAVIDYINNVKNADEDTYSDRLVNLVKALETYGLYAQDYFGYKAENLGLDKHDVSSVTADSLEAYKPVLPKTLGNGTELAGYSLVLRSATKILVYYKADSKPDMYANGSNGYHGLKESEDGLYYFELDDIYANELSEIRYLYVDSDDGKYGGNIEVSALSYAYSALSMYEGNSSKTRLCNLMRALVLYSQAAEDYFYN